MSLYDSFSNFWSLSKGYAASDIIVPLIDKIEIETYLTPYNRGDLKILPSLERASDDGEALHFEYDRWLVRVSIWQGFNLFRSEIDCTLLPYQEEM